MKDNSRFIVFFGGCSQPRGGHGGETIKNTHFVNYLRKKGFVVRVFDTVKIKRNPLLMLTLLLEIIAGKHDWVISSATPTAFNLLKWMKKIGIYQRLLLYFVIGGTIGESLRNGKMKKANLAHVSQIIVETSQLEKCLKDIGISNVIKVPNFKPVKVIPLEPRHAYAGMKLVFLSRVTESKGIFLLIDVVKKLIVRNSIQLDVYGPVGREDMVRFDNTIAGIKGICYKGNLDFYRDSTAYQKLSAYDAMVLPTNHYGEGFPGVFIDCFMAGLPVITTDWKSNAEIIQDGYNGFLLPDSRPETLAAMLEVLANSPKQLEKLRRNCLISAAQYDIDVVLNPFFDK